MLSSGPDDEWDSEGSEGSADLLAEDSDSEADEEVQPQQPAAKKRRMETDETLGLELVMRAVQHGAASSLAGPAPTFHIDGRDEAEASLMQLEVGELLKEARPDYGLESALLELVRGLAALLRALPDAEVAAEGGAATAISGFLADLAFQPVRPFVFRAPTLSQVVGSFGLHAALHPSPCLDLALLIPAACFDSKDQLNHRYFAKRALYLAHVATALSGHPQLASVGWECLADDPRRPVLVLHPQQGLSPAGFRIRLLPAAPLELCALPRLAPDRNNLRSAVAPPPPPPPPRPPPAAAAADGPDDGSAGNARRGGKAGKGGKLSKQQLKQQRRRQRQKEREAQLQREKEEAAKAAAAKQEGEAQARLLPTPHYNTSVLQDLLMLQLAQACRAAAAACPHFGEAAALLRVWAGQQQLTLGADGLSGCLLSMLLAHMVQSSTTVAGMSAMHLFRAVLVALSTPRTFSHGLLMHRSSSSNNSGSTASPPDAKAWRRAFEVVFVDGSGWLNLAASLSKAALAQARGAATRSLQLLSSGSADAFAAVFLTQQRQASLCDYWFHVWVPAQPAQAAAATSDAAAAAGEAGDGSTDSSGNSGRGSGSGSTHLHHDQPAWRSVEQRVEALATKALGTRARLVRTFRRTLHPQPPPAQQQQPAARGGKLPFRRGAARPQQEHVLLGVQVEATAALRGLDLGPSADKADAARAYRAFWGHKAELRRFQDGSIAEAVVWEGGAAGRHLIVDSIVSYILRRHLPAGTSVACHAGALDAALRRKHSTPEGDAAAARLCEAAAERLGKRLRSLAADTLPLRVMAVQPLAPVLRHAAVFPPLPHLLAGAPAGALASDHVARCLEPVEMVCQLEGSGKWADSPAAFMKMKAAMGCQLARQLHHTLGMEAQASEGWVDVLSEGFAFRLLLATERDGAMQQKAVQLSGQGRLPAEEDMSLRSWHQGAISGVAGENPAFGPTAALAKRWVGSHLLSPHLGEEAVELLLAHCFTAGGRADGTATAGTASSASAGIAAVAVAPPPASRLSGLLRFLQLLGEHPWRVQPLVVDPNGELSVAQREDIVRQHAAARAAGTAPALCMATPRDPSGAAWTEGRPSVQVLHRIAVLAQRSAAALEAQLLGTGNAAPGAAAAAAGAQGGEDTGSDAISQAAAQAACAAVFRRDLSEYDVIIRLRTDALPNASNALKLGSAATAALKRDGGGSSNGATRQQLGPALQAVNEQLVASAAAAAAAPGSKYCRAILKGIPQSVLKARGHHAVRRELLVGFDPLPLYTQVIQRRLGHLAVPCADYVGGSLVALKLRTPAFAPAPLQPEAAHLVCPAGSSDAAAAQEVAARRQHEGGAAAAAAAAHANGSSGTPEKGLSAAWVVPHMLGVLEDALCLGAGLVESIQLQ